MRFILHKAFVNFEGSYIIEIKLNHIYNMDCIVGMQQMKDKSVDMILCDLPYGITDCRWDSSIPFDLLWKEYERVI